jgi:CRISPR/Cas system CSM-associated protein Csm5 (group 7 of RAMP superfamily)
MDAIAMDIVTKKQLNILIQLAEADKHFAKVEREMVFRIAKERNFPEEVVNDIIRNPEPIGTLGALSNDQKFDYLIDCIMLMFVDQKVFESEIIFCKSIAIKLGFMKNVVDFLSKNFNNLTREELKKTVLSEYMLT